jgi:hypothetical protein
MSEVKIHNSRFKGNTAQHVSRFSKHEDLSTYMSSQHVWNTLVFLIEKTLHPLAITSKITDDIIYGLIFTSLDKRRKIAKLDPQETLQYSYHLMFLDRADRLHHLTKSIGVERGIFSDYVEDYLQGYYDPISVKSDTLFERETISNWIKDFYAEYFSFRNMVVMRFQKLSDSQAAKNKYNKDKQGLHSDSGDNNNNYLLSVFKAIDKFNPGKGTLASYVMNWLKNAAGSEYTTYTGESFTLSRSVRRLIFEGKLNVNNKSSTLDEVVEIPDNTSLTNKEEENQYLYLIGKLMRHPHARLAFLFSGFFLFPSKTLVNNIKTSDSVVIPKEWKIIETDLIDVPTIKDLQRAKREASVSQLKRTLRGKNV